MKILIVYPPCRESATPTLPQGLLYIAQPLIEDGHEDKYLEWILNSDAVEFKINLTKLPDSDLIYYHWLLADAARKNEIQGDINNKINRIEFLKFIARHYCIKIFYKVGLFNLLWNFSSKIESKKKDYYKI